MEFKGTKGEWQTNKRKSDFEVIIKARGKRICEVKSYPSDYFNDPSLKKANANAKLIAAAPGLLAVCLHVLAIKDLWLPSMDFIDVSKRSEYQALSGMEVELESAIKKAIG